MADNALVLPPAGFADLATIIDAEPHLAAVAGAAEALAGAADLPAAAAAVSSVTPLDQAEATALVAAIMRFQYLRASLGLAGEETCELISRSVESGAKPDWKAKYQDRWKTTSAHLAQLLDPKHPLATLDKSLALAYEYQNILTRSRLIADVRPVFGDEANEILRSMVSFVLSIQFTDGHDHKQIDLALDAADVEKLKTQCQRAQTKAETIQREFGRLGKPVVVAGEKTK